MCLCLCLCLAYVAVCVRAGFHFSNAKGQHKMRDKNDCTVRDPLHSFNFCPLSHSLLPFKWTKRPRMMEIVEMLASVAKNTEGTPTHTHTHKKKKPEKKPCTRPNEQKAYKPEADWDLTEWVRLHLLDSTQESIQPEAHRFQFPEMITNFVQKSVDQVNGFDSCLVIETNFFVVGVGGSTYS